LAVYGIQWASSLSWLARDVGAFSGKFMGETSQGNKRVGIKNRCCS
jgi:hypothetical protein